ncbi:MAG: DUF624 domain-containing protein [Clostridia bacterium]|nr:DUF624 domain-containing protein [Clostridia bacterium]
MFSKLMNSYYYGKSGKGDYRKDDLPKNRWQLFWEMLRIRFSSLCRLNLTVFLAWVPTMIVVLLLFNSIVSVSGIETMTDEATGAAYTAFVYAEQVDEDGNVVAAGGTASMDGVLQTTLLLLIPCILITGPVQAGMAYVTRNWARDEHAFIWADFKDAVKENWKQALGVSAITSLLPIVIYICYRFYGQMMGQSAFFMVPQMLTVCLGMVWYLGLVFMYPLMVSYRLSFRQLIKNGLMLAVARLPMTVGIRLVTLLPMVIAIAVMLFTSGWVYALMALALYYVLVGFALVRFIHASYTNGVFDRFINSRMEGVTINRGLAKEEDMDFTDEDEPDDLAQ